MEHCISTLNRERWSGKLAGHAYRNASDLFLPERILFERIATQVKDRPILDIGIGTGRTSKALHSLSADYTGIDYSPEMIRRARQRHPDIDYRCLDARDLSVFADRSFDLVCFSFNGIDYVSHEDRLQILREIKRVARTGGYFCFSAHNRQYRELEQDLRLRKFEFTPNPVKLAYRSLLHARSIYNARTLQSRQIDTPEFAILNDSEQSHGLMTYYISLQRQIEQLDRIGFGDVLAIGLDGETLDTDRECDDSYMIHYLVECP